MFGKKKPLPPAEPLRVCYVPPATPEAAIELAKQAYDLAVFHHKASTGYSLGDRVEAGVLFAQATFFLEWARTLRDLE